MLFRSLTTIDFNYLPNDYKVIVKAVEGKSGIVPAKRNYRIIFRNTKKTNVEVTFNNSEVPFTTDIDDINFNVNIPDVPSIGTLQVTCKGENIEIDAVRLVNDDIQHILGDLQIETELKDTIDKILFDKNMPTSKKSIEIRKLSKKGLDRKYQKLFKKLLEFVEQI